LHVLYFDYGFSINGERISQVNQPVAHQTSFVTLVWVPGTISLITMMSSTKVDPSPSSPSLATRKRKGEEDGTKCILQDLMTEKAPQPTSSSSKMGESDSSEVVVDPSPSSFSLATKKMKVKKESSGSDHILTADQATATEQSYNSKLEKRKVPAIRKAEYSFTTSKIQPSLVSSPMGGVVPIAAKKVNYPPPKFQFEPTLKSAVVHGTDSPLDFNGGNLT